MDTSVYWLASCSPLLPSPIVQVNLVRRLELTQLGHSQHIFGPGSTCMEHSTWVGESKSKHPGEICPLPSQIMGATQVRKNLWRPRVKLLTEEEYREQSNVETRKALEELRRCTGALQRKMRVHSILSRFCQSPSSSPWKMVTKVRNPGRLVSFLDLFSINSGLLSSWTGHHT